MHILVIKQTSLGDVLHSTGHVRALKERFPEAHLTLLTATSSHDLYRYNPWVDEIILFDRYAVKRDWLNKPLWSLRHIRDVIRQVRKRRYDLAFDLQGLAKSALFLYAARAQAKYIKGRWIGLQGYRNREQHAIDEMSAVLRLADVDAGEAHMEIHVSEREAAAVDASLAKHGVELKSAPVIVSPFSRRESKDWPIEHYIALVDSLPKDDWVLVTGSADRRDDIESLVARAKHPKLRALAGELSLMQFAELLRRARILVSGDSFPMHLAAALGTPLVSLLGPTDEQKVGPRGRASAVVLRADDCRRCDSRTGCAFKCLEKITPDEVLSQVLAAPVSTREQH